MKSKHAKIRSPKLVSALGVLADAAIAAADRAADSIDETLSYVDASNKRIAAMEAKAIKARKALDLMVQVGKEER
jgi:hypothetical protein